MDTQCYGLKAKEPQLLRVFIPQKHALDDAEEEWLAPSPPPPTPLRSLRHETSYDAQRFYPFKAMLAPTSPPRYPSPTAPEFAIEYPMLHPDVLMRHLPSITSPNNHDLRVLPSLPATCRSKSKTTFAYYSDSDSDSSSGTDTGTPAEDELTPGDIRTTYQFAGAEDDGECLIDRTIVRPLPPRRFDLTRSRLASATLRTVSSWSSLRGARSATGRCTPSEFGECPRKLRPSTSSSALASTLSSPSPTSAGSGAVPPPVSRRPSTIFSSPPLSSPVAMHEVAERLRRLAAGLSCTSGSGVARHFEESVDRYERAWPREAAGAGAMEVCITRTVTEKTTTLGGPAAGSVEFPPLVEFGAWPGRPSGIGLYATSSPRSCKNTLQ